MYYWERPKTVFLELTNCCNQRCVICPQSYDELRFEKGHMEWDLFRNVISEMSGTESISLFSSGEPLIAKNYDRIIHYCLSNLNPDKWLSLSTNGIFLTEERIRHLIGKNISISVSIDGASKTTHETIRRGSDFDVLLKNIEMVNRLKRQYNTDKPHLSIAFVAWKDNIAELPDIIKLASRFGFKQVTVIHRIFYHKEDFQRLSLCRNKGFFDTYLKDAVELARDLNIQLVHSGDFSGEIPPSPGLKEQYFKERGSKILSCRVVDEQVIIGYKGLVRACCFIDKLFMGNLTIDSFDEIWNGPLYRKLRLNLYRGVTADGCENCSFLQILKMEEKACLSFLNTDRDIPALPHIKQAYSIRKLDRDFRDITSGWEKGDKNFSTDSAVIKLIALLQTDNNLFEVANNIAVMYAFKKDMANAREWINKAKRILAHDVTIENNYRLICRA
jgi:MoaA/NifB/PqqE/SkfB family radical SAM enzyme